MNLSQKIIKPKIELLELAKKLGKVSGACKTIGYSRDSYYRFKELYEQGGEALYELSRGKPILANRVDSRVEKTVVEMAISYPAYGQLRVSNELKKQGIIVSPGGVRSIWLRNDLNNTEKRLTALEAKMAQERYSPKRNPIKSLREQEREVRSTRGDRKHASRIFRLSGYILCRQLQGYRSGIRANVYR